MSNRPGWPVMPRIQVRRERWASGNDAQNARGLPIPLVAPGQSVSPDQPVLRIERAGAGETMETIPAGLRGHVVAMTARGGIVIECQAAVVQGALGAGKQVVGTLTMWHPALIGDAARGGKLAILPGALLVVPGPVNFTMLRQASISGVVGLIASSIALRDLEGFLQTDVLHLVNSLDSEKAHENLPGMTLLFTEGSGNIAMPPSTLNLLSHYQGSIALLSGVTSTRQQVLPELVISLPPQEAEQSSQSQQQQQPETTIQVGSRVRVLGGLGGDYTGTTGQVDYLFTHQQLFSSGIRARAARVRRDDGTLLVVPLTMLERIG